MASESNRPTLLARFLDSFLQERNIKWLLGVGMVILLSSSLLPVTMHWGELPPMWKYVVFLVYTMTIFAAGQWSYHRLGLRRTGTVLQGLTVLLVPILFMVLHWVPYDSPAAAGWHLLLLAGTLAFAVLAVRQIFNHFLRTPQPTFLVCYLLLSLAGAIVPGVPSAWSPLVSLVLWAVFAAGSVKVNRHVFWLTEEHRAPRICGFLPIALLGGQFLALFILHGAAHLTLQWLGLACVLAAIPVLLTADTVARVFQQRTGDLVRPLPWSIIGPLVAGLALIASGVVLAGTGLAPPFRPQALVITTALSAGLLGVVAQRTRKAAFAWAMLGTVVLAYNFAPIFFADLVRAALQQGAQLVREERLPYAFYGLTYLPLIATLMFAASRISARHFEQPLRWFSMGLSVLLLMAALGHPKALLPVATVMLVVFSIQTLSFRDWRPAVAAMAAWFLAAFGLAPFLDRMFDLRVPLLDEFSCVTAAAALLWCAGSRIDMVLAKLTQSSAARGDSEGAMRRSLCQSASLLVTLGLGLYWVHVSFASLSPDAGWPGLAVAVLLLAHAWSRVQPWLSLIAFSFVHALVAQQVIASGWPLEILLAVITMLLLAQWLMSCWMARHPDAHVSRCFEAANSDMARCGLTGLWAVYCLLLALELARPFLTSRALHVVAPLFALPWLCRAAMLLWAFAAAYRQRSALLALSACGGLYLLVGATWVQLTGDLLWLPALWTATALICLPVTELLQRRWRSLVAADDDRAEAVLLVERPLTCFTLAVFCLVEIASFLYFSSPMRVAGVLALLGLVAFAVLRRHSGVRIPALMVINWQVLCYAVQLADPRVATLFDLNAANLLPLCLPVAFASAVSLIAWRFIPQPDAKNTVQKLAHAVQRTVLQAIVVLALVHSWNLPRLTPIDALCAAGAFALLTLSEMFAGCRNRLELRVWLAMFVAVLGVGYLTAFRVLSFGEGVSMFVLLGLAFALWAIKELAVTWSEIAALARPFQVMAFLLPMVAVTVGIYRHVFAAPNWLGANSLALLLAAGFYFWRALEQRQKALALVAGIILNVALVLLWRELVWTDPQFFMIPIGVSILAVVQLLRAELPAKLHNPLRYLGALVILVSPTFHIVGGSWLHLFCLMVASVCVVLLAIGMRLRALIYTGTAFLLADLAAMVVTGSMADANVLWISGLALGGGVIALAAYCERHREILLQRMRLLTDTLRTWE